LHEEEALFGGADCGRAEAGRAGSACGEVIRKVGISEQTFYRWKKQYVGMETDQARQMKQLQEENRRLKQLVADLSLDKTMLQDVLRKKF
jgi:putative transposase